MTKRILLGAALLLGLGGCASIGKFFGIGQPDELKGNIPLTITNPPRSNVNFGQGKEYSICDFYMITPDGTGKGKDWFGGTVEPPPRQGETREYKIKPGVYQVSVVACGGNPRGISWTSRAQMTIEVTKATNIAVMPPGAGEPQPKPGYDNVLMRTRPWQQSQYCVENRDRTTSCFE